MSTARTLPSGTLTLLFTDIEGSTRLLHEIGDRYLELHAEHRRLIRDALAAHNGFEVDTEGDAFFAVFPGATDAVDAATEIQGRFAFGPIRVRMGLHTGEPILTSEGYFGLDVHKAARIAGCGHGGQIVLSSATRDLIQAEVRDLGLHRLKDLLAPERLFQLGEGDFPPLKTLNQTNLPVQPTLFVGRARERSDVAAIITSDGARIVTLTGPGGSGKTRIALQVAVDAAEVFPDGVWFVGLASLQDPGLVPASVARALGVRETPGEAMDTTLARHLENKRTLLLLDNVEQLLPTAAKWIGDLSRASPRLRLLVTSRERLHVAGEREYAVQPMEMAEALEVFIQRANEVRPDLTIDEQSRPVIEAICSRLDRLPLAVELAAARVKVLGLAQILERLETRLPLLVGGARDAPARQRTLRATIEWSFDLLDDMEKTLFARLAVFSGGCGLEAVETVCEADLDTLASLVDKSLVRAPTTDDGDPRYLMLETVREFAQELLRRRADAESVRHRHASHFAAFADRSGEELKGSNQDRWLRDLEIEHDNVRSALRWLMDNEPAVAIRMAGTLWLFWYVHGHNTEGRSWLREAIDRAPAVSEARAIALDGAGYLAGEQADPEARALLEESLRCARAVGSDAVAALVSSHLSYRALDDDRTQARSLGEEAVALGRASGDRYTLAVALNNLGEVMRAIGDPARAIELYEEGYRIRCEIGDSSRIALSLVNLGEMAFLSGDLPRARDLFAEALERARRIGDKRHGAFAVGGLGWVALAEGRPVDAERFLREALVLTRELGQKQYGLETLKALAGAAAARDDVGRAARIWSAVLTLGRDVAGPPTSTAEGGEHLRWIDALRERTDAAEWEAASRVGAAMSLDDAFAEALSGR